MISSAEEALAARRFVVLALVLFWAVELFVIQEATLVELNYYRDFQPVLHRLVRGALDLLFCGALVLLLPRLVLGLIFGVGLVFSGVVLSFANYTGRALSATMVMSTAGEGTSVASAGYSMLPPWMILLVVTLGAKLYLVYRLGRVEERPLARRWKRAAALGAGYLVLVFSMSVYKPFTLLLGWENTGGMGSLYGYLPTWTAELVLLDSDEIRARALARAAVRSDRLAGIEPELPPTDRLVFLQVESLDEEVSRFAVDGKVVTPRLRALREKSMSYVVQAPKLTGSCDADFTALTGTLSSADMPNYKIPDYPFDATFVHALNDQGYETAAIHNVIGDFFNRRFAFEKMAFDELLFREELDEMGLPGDDWAIPDHEMLPFAARYITEAPIPSFSLVITATSHIPFHYTPEEQRVFFPGSEDLAEGYIDSMHYVDRAIGDFVDRLPEGTIVVLYGDHGSTVASDSLDYRLREVNDVGLVPLLIHRVGDDLSRLQRSQDKGLAESGELTLLDLMTYVHRSAKRSVMARHTGP